MPVATPTSSAASPYSALRVRGLPRSWRWNVERFDQATKLGWFDRQRLELIEGKVIRMAPQYEPHAASILLTSPLLSSAFGAGHCVRVQMPLRLGDRSKPQPDLSVVVGSPRDYVKSGAPTSALLVVEAADATLAFDRGRKAALYAKFNVTDYWIIDLVDRQVEVHRAPIADATHRFKFRYADVRVYKAGERITPLAAPGAALLVDDMLP